MSWGIWGRLVCYCVSVAHPQHQDTRFQPSASDVQQAVSHAVWLCFASAMLPSLKIYKALKMQVYVVFLFFFLLSQPDGIELLFYSEAKLFIF